MKIRVFPDHKRWLPDAGVVMDTLTEQIAIRERQQRAQTILTHQPSSRSQRIRH
ncbi:hypothetical protein HNQ91_002268 [Filimonas zeae]|uniref:hypothetical protein n=1 Tax=Filimonas zeae TaxID=1737353 RepID=UPI001669BD33|nr:hypothetical protein [Filimonas zeae]MDR6339217.1 hypothetical protein [Filimonas zeae]